LDNKLFDIIDVRCNHEESNNMMLVGRSVGHKERAVTDQVLSAD